MMCPAIDNPANCKIRAVFRFLHTKIMSGAEIHLELCAAYGQNAVSEGTANQWCRMFKDERTVIHDEERSGRPAICSER
jgi:transposase